MNKKIVFLVVLLECILAVFVVSVFGHAIEDFRTEILCQELYFATESGEKIEDNQSIEVKLTDANMSYQLYWVMETAQTSNKEVEFISSKPNRVKVNSLGLVTFLEETDVVITIRAKDGSEQMDSITLMPKRGGGIVDII